MFIRFVWISNFTEVRSHYFDDKQHFVKSSSSLHVQFWVTAAQKGYQTRLTKYRGWSHTQMGVQRCLRRFFSSLQLLTLCKGLIQPCMECSSDVKGDSTNTDLLDINESRAFRLLNSSPLTDYLLLLSHAAMLHVLLSSTAIFMPMFLQSCWLHAFLPPAASLHKAYFLPLLYPPLHCKN